MARASVETLLSLDRYAKIFGIPPIHFNGAGTPSLSPVVFPQDSTCSSVWFQYDWQYYDKVSREQLAMAIKNAEEEIASIIGYYPAPMWINEEKIHYPRPYRREYFGDGKNIRAQMKSVNTKYGRVRSIGQRALTLLGTPTVVYTDEDSDDFEETATITINDVDVDDLCEIKAYFTGYDGDPVWEIRQPSSVTLVGSTLTMVFDSWLLIDPDLWEAYPTSAGMEEIDISGTGNYVTTIDVYREYTNTAVKSVDFYWEAYAQTCTECSGTGCDVCQNTTQDGCANIRESEAGIIVPVPANYDSDDAQWNKTTWTGCREPDYISLWYRAGDVDKRYLSGHSCDPLSNYWAQTIAWLATARLSRDFCSCNNLKSIGKDLQEDLSMSAGGKTYFSTIEIINNPLGTRRGEVMAWKRISKQVPRIMNHAVI